MLGPTAAKTSFILHNLDESLALQLRKAASDSGLVFYASASTAECLALTQRLHVDAVFCGSEPQAYREILEAMRRRGLSVPVVVVSRIPEVSEWLNAIEAGATDYCAAPFEQRDMSWLIQSALLAPLRVHA